MSPRTAQSGSTVRLTPNSSVLAQTPSKERLIMTARDFIPTTIRVARAEAAMTTPAHLGLSKQHSDNGRV